MNYIFLRLQLIYRVQLIERKSVIIFDEIQKAPLARQAIKHHKCKLSCTPGLWNPRESRLDGKSKEAVEINVTDMKEPW